MLVSRIKKLVTIFVAYDAPKEINISYATRQKILTKVAPLFRDEEDLDLTRFFGKNVSVNAMQESIMDNDVEDAIDASVFRKAIFEVFSMMHKDTMKRFRKTELFRDYLQTQ